MFLNIIDQMRITVPQEIRLAKEMQAERDKYVAQAHDEASQIIAQAREDAARMLDEHQLRKEAAVQADLIIKRAREDAERIHAGADEYAESRLKELGQLLEQWQVSIQKGLSVLERRHTGTSAGDTPNS
jgi:F0F1-type ATP synthase membrane subunit b/b'